MRKRTLRGAMCPLLIVGALVSAGCNIFGWTHEADEPSDYIAEGREYMSDAKYEEAAEEFQKAIDADPTDAEARYLHAKARVLGSGVSIAQLADQMTGSDPGDLPLFSPEVVPGSANVAAGPGRSDSPVPVIRVNNYLGFEPVFF